MLCVCVHLLQVFRLALVLTTQPLLLPLANGLARVYTCSAGDSWLHSELPCYGIVHSALTVVGSGMLFALWLVAFVGTCFLRAFRLPALFVFCCSLARPFPQSRCSMHLDPPDT